MTKNNTYTPTVAEQRLLETLSNPENTGKSITELCNLANVSRNKYYDAMDKQGFKDLKTELIMANLEGKIGDVINASYKYALEEKGHQDRKMLLQMAGIHADKQDINQTGDVSIRVEWAE